MSGDYSPHREAWEADARSVLNAACGRDDSDDEHVDWVTDVLAALWSITPTLSTRDPAASAPLSELVAVNVAGDIEAVARNIRERRTLILREWVRDEFPLPPMVHWLETWELALEVIAAGIREGQS